MPAAYGLPGAGAGTGPGTGAARVLLAALDARTAPDVEAAVALIGGDVAKRCPLEEAAGACVGFDGVAVFDGRGAEEAALHRTVAAIARTADADGVPLIVAMTLAQVDVVVDATGGMAAQLLCDPDQAEWIRALVTAGLLPPSSGGVRDPGDEADRLARLREEIARIADALARLGTPGSGGAAERRGTFEAAPVVTDVTAPEVRDVIRARRLRDRFFGTGLFEDPAWDMLLDLFAAELEGARVSVSSLCIAAAVAPTTALRWIGRLTDAGLLERAPDAADRRRAFVKLSPVAGVAMRGFVAATRAAGLSMV